MGVSNSNFFTKYVFSSNEGHPVELECEKNHFTGQDTCKMVNRPTTSSRHHIIYMRK
jgi:hypothetical protein